MQPFRALVEGRDRFARRLRARQQPNLETLEGRQLMAVDVAQFPLPSGAFVGQMVPGPFGAVWFQKQSKSTTNFSLELTSTLAYITPNGQEFDFPLPEEDAGPFTGSQAIAAGPDGSLNVLVSSRDGSTGQIDYGIDHIAADGTITELHLSKPIATAQFLKDPTNSQSDADQHPIYTSLYMTTGSDGSVYVASGMPGAGGYYPFRLIDRITPDGTVTETAVARYSAGPIAATADGNVWYTLGGGGSESAELIRVAPDGYLTTFDLTGYFKAPSLLATADGSLWFTETTAMDGTSSPAIGRMAPDGTLSSYPINLPGGSLGQLAAGSDGLVYFTAMAAANPDGSPGSYLVESISTDGTVSAVTSFDGAADWVDADAASLATGPNGQLWFAQNRYQDGTSQIGTAVVNPGYALPPFVVPSTPPIPIAPPAPPTVPVPPTTPPVTTYPIYVVVDPGNVTLTPYQNYNPGGPAIFYNAGAMGGGTASPVASVASVQPSAVARGRSAVVLHLTQPLNAHQAKRPLSYLVERAGHLGHSVAVASAHYNAVDQTVTIRFRHKLASDAGYRVTISTRATRTAHEVLRWRTGFASLSKGKA